MARQWRIEYPDALYHILSRGNNRQDIFLDDDDRNIFLDILDELSERFNFEIYAYVSMDNHYHILLKTLNANLSKGMQWLGTKYTRKFNNRHMESGHLFQGRFKSILVENDTYLLQLSCYIHRNPLRAGIVDRLADYPWSSYQYYAYKKKPPEWLNTSAILRQFQNVDDKHKAYRLKVQNYSDEENNPFENIKHGLIYGSQNFINKIKANFLSKEIVEELPQHNRLLKDIRPDDLLVKGCQVLKCDLEDFQNSRRISDTNLDKRDLLIYLLWEIGYFTNQQIGDIFKLTYSSVSRRVNKFRNRIKKENSLLKLYKATRSQIKV